MCVASFTLHVQVQVYLQKYCKSNTFLFFQLIRNMCKTVVSFCIKAYLRIWSIGKYRNVTLKFIYVRNISRYGRFGVHQKCEDVIILLIHNRNVCIVFILFYIHILYTYKLLLFNKHRAKQLDQWIQQCLGSRGHSINPIPTIRSHLSTLEHYFAFVMQIFIKSRFTKCSIHTQVPKFLADFQRYFFFLNPVRIR